MRFTRVRAAILGALLVAAVASAVFLPRLGEPKGAVWDESYYLTALERQLEHRAQFASHPPLGFLLMATGARLAGDRESETPHLGRDKKIPGKAIPPTYDYRGARTAGAVAGVLGAVAFYGLMFALTERIGAALLLSNLFTFENAFAAQFRAAQLDGFFVFFILLALYALVLALRRDRPAPWLEIGFGAAVGLAAMVKLAAVCLAFGGVALLARRLLLRRGSAEPVAVDVGRCIASGLTMTAGFIAAVALVFTWQTLDGYRPPDAQSAAGRKDVAFVSPLYADYLQGRRPLDASVVVAAAWDDWTYMTADMAGMPRRDANGSSPAAWPLMQRPILYRWDKTGPETRYVALIGNPAGWALGLCGLIAGLWTALCASSPRRRATASALLALWGVFMICHLCLGQTRVMYLYHYFPGLILSWTLLAVALAEGMDRRSATALGLPLQAIGVAHLAAFLLIAPFSFHTPLTHGWCEIRSLAAIDCRGP